MKVTTQAELDSALADDTVRSILIDSTRGVWINIPDTRGKEVVVGATATIDTITGTVERVDSGGTVKRVDSGGTVERVYSGGTVERVDSGGTVKWVDSGGTVKWVDSGGTVERVDSGGTVHLNGGRVDRAGSHAAVFLHSASVVTRGGVIIDLTEVNKLDPRTWCEFYGVEIVDERAILFKALNADLQSGHYAPGASTLFEYPIGETVEAPDWADNNACGRGLHFSPSPADAEYYNTGAKRFAKVAVPLEVLRPIDDGGAPKCKAQRAEVLEEVTRAGDAIAAVVAS